MFISVVVSINKQDDIRNGFRSELVDPVMKVFGFKTRIENPKKYIELGEERNHTPRDEIKKATFINMFESKVKQADDQVEMVNNLKFINNLLESMTWLLDNRYQSLKGSGDAEYYSIEVI